MQKLPKGAYTKEFREQAVKLVLEEGLSLREAGQRLSLSPKTLQNWVIAARKGTLKEVGSAQRPLTETEQELARVKLERDLLKKAAAYIWTSPIAQDESSFLAKDKTAGIYPASESTR